MTEERQEQHASGEETCHSGGILQLQSGPEEESFLTSTPSKFRYMTFIDAY